MWVGAHSQHSSKQLITALAFTSCLCRALRLARGESLGHSQIFPLHLCSPRHVLSPTHTHGLLDSQDYDGAFQNSYGHLILLLFLLGFLIRLLFSPNVIHHLRQP